VECKVKYIFCVDASLLFYILQKNYVSKFAYILVICYSVYLLTLGLGVLESVLSHEIMLLPSILSEATHCSIISHSGLKASAMS